MSEVQQTDQPLGISRVGHHRGDMLLPGRAAGATRRAQAHNLLKLWQRLASLKGDNRSCRARGETRTLSRYSDGECYLPEMQDADEGGELSRVGDHGMRLWILAGIAGHASRAEAYNVPAVRIRLGGLTALALPILPARLLRRLNLSAWGSRRRASLSIRRPWIPRWYSPFSGDCRRPGRNENRRRNRESVWRLYLGCAVRYRVR